MIYRTQNWISIVYKSKFQGTDQKNDKVGLKPTFSNISKNGYWISESNFSYRTALSLFLYQIRCYLQYKVLLTTMLQAVRYSMCRGTVNKPNILKYKVSYDLITISFEFISATFGLYE